MPSHDVNAMAERIRFAIAEWQPERKGTCQVPNCPNDVQAKNYCNAHYLRHRNGKSLDFPLQRPKALSKGERARRIKQVLVNELGGQCQKCQQSYPLFVYDFHHVGAKTANIGDLFSTASVERIADEISNCTLLCANCHRITEHGS